jgi:hypothetical protein
MQLTCLLGHRRSDGSRTRPSNGSHQSDRQYQTSAKPQTGPPEPRKIGRRSLSYWLNRTLTAVCRRRDRREYTLTSAYMQMATQDAATQLSRAGIRLAMVLNQTLSGQQ